MIYRSFSYIFLYCLLYCTEAINVTVNDGELDKFRTGETRNISLAVTELNEQHVILPNSITVQCADQSICEILTASIGEVSNGTILISARVKAVFLGLTDLKVVESERTLGTVEMRILRSAQDHMLTIIFTVLIGIFILCITFMMGTQLEARLLIGILKSPVGPIIGFCCQFGLMPILGFLLAEYGLPESATSLKLALFSVSTCPGGGKSSFWTIIFGGNLNLSTSMTFAQTISALFMMPLWMTTVGKRFTDAHIKIPFARILQGLVAIVFPTAVGMVFAYYKPDHVKVIHTWIKRVSWAAMIVIGIFAVYTNFYMFYLITWPIFLCGCALPWLGYLAAFGVALLLRQEFKDALTIAIETGIQNIGIAMLLIVWCLPEPESDISITIIFVVALMTDKPLVIIWLSAKIYKKCCKKDTIQEINVTEKVKALEINPENKVDMKVLSQV